MIREGAFREDLVGRSAERERLARAVDVGLAGSPATVAICGEPGIGKTRLLTELIELAEDQGALTLRGRAAQFERDVPFAVFLDALDGYLASQTAQRFVGIDPGQFTELARIFPSLRARQDGSPGAGQSERYLAHRAVGALLDRLARPRPLVLALDDLQWADGASLELLAHLLRRRPGGAQLLGLAFRPGEAPTRLADAVDSALADDRLQRLDLGPLSAEEASAMVSVPLDPETSDWLYRESGGNPFYLEQLHRSGRMQGPIDEASAASPGGVPQAVTASLAGELRALSSSARRLIEGASVAGDPFDLEVAAGAAELADGQSREAIDELLIRELAHVTEVPRRFRFRHPIVHRAVYAGTTSGWRIGAHARARDVLAEQGAGPASLAHHVDQAATPGDEEAIDVLERAARDSARLSPGAAANWLGAALRLLPAGETARRFDLLVPMATALAASGQLEQGRATVLEALDLLPADAASERTRLITQLATVNHLLGRRRESTSVLRSELERVGDLSSPEAIALRIELSVSSYYGADWTGTRDSALQALDAAKAREQPPLRVSAEALVGLADLALGRLSQAQSRVDAAAELFDSLDDSELGRRLDAAFHLGLAEFLLERYEDGARHGHRGVAVARSTGQGQFLTQIKVAEALSLIELGRAGEAEAVAEEMLEEVRLAANPQGVVWALWVRARVAGATGRLDEALKASEEALAVDAELDPSVVSVGVRTQFATICAEAGDYARCMREMDRAGAPDFRGFYPERRIRCWEGLSQAALGLGEPDRAERWVARCEALADGLDLPVAVAVARRARSRLLLAGGRPAPAAEQALEAAALQASRGAVVESARSRILAGRALEAAGQPERAIVELERARAELEACGVTRYRDEAAHELRRLGRRVPRVAPRPTATVGVVALSEREREIAALAAGAKTNREIASTLFISQKTVEKHLSKVFAKLGVKGRAAIGAKLVESRTEK